MAALPGGNAQSSMTIVATGSSLPEPLYVAWGDEYHKQHPEAQFRYLAEGTAESLHLPSAPGELRLSGPVLADIFLGKIKTWSDPAIAKLNPGMKLPAKAIQVIHRTDGKGSNDILSDFLSKVSPEFMGKLGRGESPKWRVGTSAARS